MSEKTNGNEIPSEDKVGMRTLMVTLSSLLFNHEECQVITFRDVTQVKKLAKIETANKFLNMMTSSVTHEMITPLKCIISFSDFILKDLIDKKSNAYRSTQLINTTSKLLFSQVKLLLDKNILKHDLFLPNLELNLFNKTVQDAIDILTP